MSLHLHLSAHSDELLAGLRPALAAARTALLASTLRIPHPIPVLVPAAQLGDWLKVRLARELGLSMGFEFLQPADYFGRHFATGKFEQSLAKSHAFWAPDNLRWHILPLVETFAGKLGHDAGHSLLPRDRFAFAQVLAQQFDRYARHRPDWPNLWVAGKSGLTPGACALPPAALDDEQWQRDLWRSLAAQPGTPLHPAQWIAHYAAAPRPDCATDAPELPPLAESEPPLFIVGADLLDPLLLRTMQLLVHQGRTVSLHLLLPTLGYLGDQTRRNALLTQLAAVVPEETLELGGHPLLSSLGQQAVGNFLLLETLSPDYSAWPEVVSQFEAPPADASLLQRLQADVRVQRTPPGPPLTEASADVRPHLAVTDLSLRIHSCHSPRRELEVLRDELLRAFTDLPDLKPEEVLIAVTDFDTYAPLAQGILRGGPVHLPVRLTAIPSREANPVAVALLALLQLATGRHSASELVELLNLTALQQNLGLVDEPAGLAHLADTIRASGLTHDIDTTTRDHADATGTWRAALDRHLAGSWLGPISTARDADGAFVHPLSPELHQADEVRLRFIRWLSLLAEQQLTWLTEATASIWAIRLETTVKTLLHASNNDDHAAAVLRLLGELKQVAAATPLDVGTLIDWLQPKLENATSLRTSMGGEILFGRLDQLHGLPCRVFALLGLQDGAFPRASRRPAWDLLAHRPERWDADSRRQDRQCFLDCLLTPTDRLILTAANRSLRTPHDGPLASCVEELLRTAAATMRPAEGTPAVEKQLVHLHRIQPFSAEYFADSTALPRSFDSTSARIAKNLLAASARPPTPFTSASLSSPSKSETVTTLTLAQLIQFWKDPAAAWLRALQVEIPHDEADDTALNDSPLNLNGLQDYLANEAALATRLPQAKTEAAEARSRLIADRALPPGALGALAWDRYDRAIAPLASELTPFVQLTAPQPITLKLAGGVELSGEVQLGQPNVTTTTPWVLVHRPGKYKDKPKHHLGAFIQTLAAALELNRGVSCHVCGLDDVVTKILPAISAEQARQLLDLLITGYRQGQLAPLCYAPKTSGAMASSLNKSDDSAALDAASASWSLEPYNDSPAGDGFDASALLAWRDTDPFAAPYDAAWLAWGRSIAVPLSNWWNNAAATPPPSGTTPAVTSGLTAGTAAVKTPGKPEKSSAAKT